MHEPHGPGTGRVVLRIGTVAMLAAATIVASCATLEQVAALRRVDFAIDRVATPRLAGVDVSRVRSYTDLSPLQIAAIGAAVARGELPFAFDLHIAAENPADNPVSARLLEMEWSLFLEDRETISGTLARSFVMPPGEVTDIPLRIELDLVEFFDSNVQDLVDMVLAVTGQGGSPRRISLRARPTIETPIGPIRYPEAITIVAREVGTSR